MVKQNDKIILAYSGGLDTSVAISWLKDKAMMLWPAELMLVKARTWMQSKKRP